MGKHVNQKKISHSCVCASNNTVNEVPNIICNFFWYIDIANNEFAV